MKRVAARVLVFLVVGSGISLTVAWLAAARSEQLQYLRDDKRSAKPVDLPGYVRPFWPPTLQYSEAVGQGWGVNQSEVLCSDIDSSICASALYQWNEGPIRAILTRVRFGWPMHSMYYDDYGLQGGLSKEAKQQFFARCEAAAGWRQWRRFPDWVPVSSGSRGAFPRAIEPLGFAVNTVFYGGMLFLGVLGPGFVRRWRRVRHGLCPRCAYPVGTSPVCPECGTKVTPRTGATA